MHRNHQGRRQAAQKKVSHLKTVPVLGGTAPAQCQHPVRDLRQTVLAEADLAFADLTGAKLRATDFRGAILQGIKLSLDGAVEAIFDETRYDVAAAG